VHVLAGVGCFERHPVAAYFGGAQDFGSAPAGGDRDWGWYRFGAGSVQAGDGEVGGQPGDRRQFGVAEQKTPAF
jgi:hypothetical protein